MRASVLGAGIFGCTIALELRALGMHVTLYDPRGILGGASGRNHNRLHLGYHYPRSLVTAFACRDSCGRFSRYYPGVVCHSAKHYYAIASEGSLTDPSMFENFCNTMKISAKPVVPPDIFRGGRIEACYETYEPWLDLDHLREILRERLKVAGVWVSKGRITSADDVVGSDLIINATYSEVNEVNAMFDVEPLDITLEDVTMARFIMPHKPVAATILDGPFCSFMPEGRRVNTFLAYHVSASLGFDHQRVMEETREWFNLPLGVATDSIYVRRAVIENADDARPTLVTQTRKPHFDFWTVFSGKISTCVDAAQKISSAYA